MKRQDELSVGGSIILTIVFAVMAVFTYQTDSSGEGNPLAWIPGVGVVAGIIMTIIAAINASNKVREKNNKRNLQSPSPMTVALAMVI